MRQHPFDATLHCSAARRASLAGALQLQEDDAFYKPMIGNISSV